MRDTETSRDLDASGAMPDVVIWSVLLVLAGASFYEMSKPSGSLLLALLAMLWFVALVAFVVAGVAIVLGRRERKRVALRWILPLMGVLALTVASVNDVPEKTRFHFSENELNDAADRAQQGERVAGGSIGWYKVDEVAANGWSVELRQNGNMLESGWVLVRDRPGGSGSPYFDCVRLDARWDQCQIPGASD